MAIKKFLSESGFKHFVEKVIGKTDISSVGDGTLKGAVSSLNLKLDENYTQNVNITEYVTFGHIKKIYDGSYALYTEIPYWLYVQGYRCSKVHYDISGIISNDANNTNPKENVVFVKGSGISSENVDRYVWCILYLYKS